MTHEEMRRCNDEDDHLALSLTLNSTLDNETQELKRIVNKMREMKYIH
jgi:hypothetical protein